MTDKHCPILQESFPSHTFVDSPYFPSQISGQAAHMFAQFISTGKELKAKRSKETNRIIQPTITPIAESDKPAKKDQKKSKKKKDTKAKDKPKLSQEQIDAKMKELEELKKGLQ